MNRYRIVTLLCLLAAAFAVQFYDQATGRWWPLAVAFVAAAIGIGAYFRRHWKALSEDDVQRAAEGPNASPKAIASQAILDSLELAVNEEVYYFVRPTPRISPDFTSSVVQIVKELSTEAASVSEMSFEFTFTQQGEFKIRIIPSEKELAPAKFEPKEILLPAPAIVH